MSNPPGLPPYQAGPRRFSSYASVAAGQSQSQSPSQQPQPAIPQSQAARHSYSTTASGGAPPYPAVIQGALSALQYPPSGSGSGSGSGGGQGHSRRVGAGSLDADAGMAGSLAGGLSSSWGRTGMMRERASTLEVGSTAYGYGYGHAHGHGYGSSWKDLARADAIAVANASAEEAARLLPPVIPSYLRGTRHARRLEEAHAARVNSQRESTRSGLSSLSTSSSSVNVHKMVPSHRGMTHDIIERSIPTTSSSATAALLEDPPAPLPSRWVVGSDVTGVDLLNGGTEARYSGVTKGADDAAGWRSEVPIPRECGVFYYEVTVQTKAKEGAASITIGLVSAKTPLRRMPGWEPDSYGYMSDDGHIALGNGSAPRHYGAKFGNGDVIGCGFDFRRGTLFFTKNGYFLGEAQKGISSRSGGLFPAVGVKKAGDGVRVNFGRGEFVFGIDQWVERERQTIWVDMMRTDAGALAPPLTEPQLLHKLVAQYLAHDGYIETARAFAAEVRQESQSLAMNISSSTETQDLEPEEDVDAIHRQKIRSAILEGDIDRALKYTSVYYPSVLEDNPSIYFKLKCRKFIEMIRRCAELSDAERNSSATTAISGKARRSSPTATIPDFEPSIFDQEMDLDLHTTNGHSHSHSHSPMETSTDSLRDREEHQPRNYNEMIQRTLEYGTLLKTEFDVEGARRDVKKTLEDTLALIGYEDPRTSPLGYLLDEAGRGPVCEELNRVILVSLGKSSSSAIENLFAQTDVLLDVIGKDGGPGALIDLRRDRTRGGRIL